VSFWKNHFAAKKPTATTRTRITRCTRETMVIPQLVVDLNLEQE
jgi:hypothetical protein